MDGLLVSELAQRSGLPATTLRFYEQQGLLTAGRSSSGYRIYDDAAVERLGFIVTAKRLGLPLSEIRQLLQSWEHGMCRDVQAELEPLISARIAETGERIAELREFVAGLIAAREHLTRIDRDGPCDRSCTFLQDPMPRPRLEALPRSDQAGCCQHEGAEAIDEPTTIACSLDAGQRADRVGRWSTVLEAVTARRRIEGGLRLEFDGELVDVADLARLAAAEAECCPFLDLRLCFGPALALEVRAPVQALEVLAELFGEPI